MFAPDWNEGCKSCSFWADGFERMIPHLAARDTTLVAISRAPLAKLDAFKARMGWTFDWFSSAANDFNYDYAVSFTPDEIKSGAKIYNFGTSGFGVEEAPGISVFYRDEAGNIFHTYSCFARGLDMMNAAYHYLDLTPLGRHEEGLPYPMDWLRLRDQYEPAAQAGGVLPELTGLTSVCSPAMARSMASISAWVSMNLIRARSALSRSNGAARVLAKASRSSAMRSRAFFSVSSRSLMSVSLSVGGAISICAKSAVSSV